MVFQNRTDEVAAKVTNEGMPSRYLQVGVVIVGVMSLLAWRHSRPIMVGLMVSIGTLTILAIALSWRSPRRRRTWAIVGVIMAVVVGLAVWQGVKRHSAEAPARAAVAAEERRQEQDLARRAAEAEVASQHIAAVLNVPQGRMQFVSRSGNVVVNPDLVSGEAHLSIWQDNGYRSQYWFPIRKLDGRWHLGCPGAPADGGWISFQDQLRSGTLVTQYVAEHGGCPVDPGPVRKKATMP